MRSSNVFLKVGISLGFLWLAACAQVPVEELRTYAETYEQARDAGDLLLDEVAPVVSGEDRSECAINKAGYRPCFKVAFALGPEAVRRDEDPAVRVRRLTLASVVVYNQLLIDLAEGKSADALGLRIDEMADLVSAAATLIPTAPVAALPIDLVKGLAVKFEKMRTAAIARTSILESKDDVKELIGALIDDTEGTGGLYRLYVIPLEKEIGNLVLDRQLAVLSGDAEKQAEVQAKIDAKRDQILAFEASLIAYVQLLDRSEKSLDLLVSAIQNPSQSPIASATSIIREAVETRAKAEEFFKKIRELRAAETG